MVPKHTTASFAIRVDASLLEQVRRVCVARDESISQVVRRALRAYVAAGAAQLDLEDAIAVQVKAGAVKPRKRVRA